MRTIFLFVSLFVLSCAKEQEVYAPVGSVKVKTELEESRERAKNINEIERRLMEEWMKNQNQKFYATSLNYWINVENFDQIDTPAYLVHSWMKYPKFAHASATDYAARMIRYGMITRDEALKLVKKHDHALDPRSVREFCEFMGYTETEFWEIVDTLYNQELFKKDKLGSWSLI